jgi:hypothetical protein
MVNILRTVKQANKTFVNNQRHSYKQYFFVSVILFIKLDNQP